MPLLVVSAVGTFCACAQNRASPVLNSRKAIAGAINDPLGFYDSKTLNRIAALLYCSDRWGYYWPSLGFLNFVKIFATTK